MAAPEEFPVDDFQRREVSFEVGEEIDLSKLPKSSPTFDSQGWYEAASAIEAASVASIAPVYLVVGDNPNSPAGPKMRGELPIPPAGGIMSSIVNPSLEVLPVGKPTFYDSETGALEVDDTEGIEPAPGPNDDAMVPGEDGLYRVSMGGLQASIAVVIEQAMEQAYVAGRLDQANEGTNRQRFIKARELGAVVAHAEWLATFPAKNPHQERVSQIIGQAVKKFGSIAAALQVERD